jgi:hypothetical protein
MRTALALLAAFFAAIILLVASSVAEAAFFKPHELGALLGTAFVYGRLILIIWVARTIYKKVKGKHSIDQKEPASPSQTSTSPITGSTDIQDTRNT